MSKRWTKPASVALFCWLGAGFAVADLYPYTSVDSFNVFADSLDGFPSQTFRSSDIVAPVFQVNTFDHEAVDDAPHIFIGSVYGENKAGPMILDARDLSLVYADQKWENTYTSEVQTIKGAKYLTFWEGYHTRGHANGFCLFYDEEYNLRYNVTAQELNGALADMHEFQVTDQGTAIFSTYYNIPYDLTPFGGPPDSLLMNSGFQEVDVETNQLLFQWNALDHFDVADSYAEPIERFGVGDDSGFDYFHINSIQKLESGNFLVSSRHLSMLTLIDGHDGHPIWVLGGKKNEFVDMSSGTATNFGWQHDARFISNNQITMFDNHGEFTGSCGEHCHTRGLHIEIDEVKKTATVVMEYYHPQHVDAGAMGGIQKLKNGNTLVAWGHSPGFVEFSEGGRPVMDVQRGILGQDARNDMFAYRVHKGNWTGRPTWPPSLAMDAPYHNSQNATVYVSWNGATNVAKWAIFSSDNPRDIHEYSNFIVEANRTGFETLIYLGSNRATRFVAAAAVDSNNNIIDSSFIFDMFNGEPVIMRSHILSLSPPEMSSLESSLKDTNSAGLAIAGVVAVVALFSVAMYCYRKRTGSRTKRSEYKPIATDVTDV